MIKSVLWCFRVFDLSALTVSVLCAPRCCTMHLIGLRQKRKRISFDMWVAGLIESQYRTTNHITMWPMWDVPCSYKATVVCMSHTVSQHFLFLLLHFHWYCCFHSSAVIQLDVPLINTNVWNPQRAPALYIAYSHSVCSNRLVRSHKARDLTSTSWKEYTLYWISEHLNLPRRSKQTNTGFVI